MWCRPLFPWVCGRFFVWSGGTPFLATAAYTSKSGKRRQSAPGWGVAGLGGPAESEAGGRGLSCGAVCAPHARPWRAAARRRGPPRTQSHTRALVSFLVGSLVSREAKRSFLPFPSLHGAIGSKRALPLQPGAHGYDGAVVDHRERFVRAGYLPVGLGFFPRGTPLVFLGSECGAPARARSAQCFQAGADAERGTRAAPGGASTMGGQGEKTREGARAGRT